MRQFSIVTRINIALACIVMLAVGTMLASYWLSDKTDNDAHAVNVAGSLRMQTYRMAWLTLQQDEHKLRLARQQLAQTWQHPVFARFISNDKIATQLEQAKLQWQRVDTALALPILNMLELEQILQQQINLLEQLVYLVQQDAEQKVRGFRTLQLIALLATVLPGVMATPMNTTVISLALNDRGNTRARPRYRRMAGPL